MASGKLGIAQLSAGTDTIVYTVPSSTLAVVNFNMVNLSASADANITVSISEDSSPSAGEYIEYGARLNPSGVLERTGIAMSAGEKLIFNSDLNSVNIRIHGIEETIE